MNIHDLRHVHLIGIGGINMSAVAKVLLAAGVHVSGSDQVENEQTRILAARGVDIALGHAAGNIPLEAQLVLHSSAVPESNPERLEAKRRGVLDVTNFQFLGQWFAEAQVILVVGTHGKSTTTAMLGLILERAGFDPTVVVGSKVPGFPDGNLRLGFSSLCVIEGDEYARHFLEFRPHAIVLNNIELDHTDVFPTMQDMMRAFADLLDRVQERGIVVANMGDANVRSLMSEKAGDFIKRQIRVVDLEGASENGWHLSFSGGESQEACLMKGNVMHRFRLMVPGFFNALNASGAALMALEFGASVAQMTEALESFTGIWRRFEKLCEINQATFYSDYGHHPGAVVATLRAARDSFPSSRLVVCFQPHHRNRTKHLFLEFVSSFDVADVLVLCEIYDVIGRDAEEDANISSLDLQDAVIRHDADRGVTRIVEYAPNPGAAIRQTLSLARPGDIVLIMGAGDIDQEARTQLCPSSRNV